MSWSQPKHPIIVLWCHPRSMSTATERIMRERGDLTCFHEPFMHYYYVGCDTRRMPHFEADPGSPTDFSGVWGMLLKAAEAGPVFSKDMAYYVGPEVVRHPDLATLVRHAFLIRDPRRAILSYHKLDPDLTLTEIGIEAQWRLALWIEKTTGRRPAVVEAEAIQADPRMTMRALWADAGLADRPDAFEWSDDTPKDWKHVAGWHETVSASSAIRPPSDEMEIKEAFQREAVKHPKLADYLAHHEPFYRRLRAWTLPATPTDEAISRAPRNSQ